LHSDGYIIHVKAEDGDSISEAPVKNKREISESNQKMTIKNFQKESAIYKCWSKKILWKYSTPRKLPKSVTYFKQKQNRVF